MSLDKLYQHLQTGGGTGLRFNCLDMGWGYVEISRTQKITNWQGPGGMGWLWNLRSLGGLLTISPDDWIWEERGKTRDLKRLNSQRSSCM